MLRPIVLILAMATLAPACKPRNPEDGGLLSEEDAVAPLQATVAPGGQFHLTCQPSEPDANQATTYSMDVAGAVNEQDESQDVLVTVQKTTGASTNVLADKVQGRGALSVQGPVFVGFAMGVLTADAQPGGKPGAHAGVLTLANDKTADGLKVSCAVEKLPPTAPGA